MPLSAVLLSGVRMEDSGAAPGAMQRLSRSAPRSALRFSCRCAPAPESGLLEESRRFSAGIADAFVAGTAFAALFVLLVAFGLRRA